MCSIDWGLWCWDATTQAASDDTPSQYPSWRVLSFSFQVRVCQGRVTLPHKSLRGVRAPNNVVSPPSGITEAQTDKLAMGAKGVVESFQGQRVFELR